MKPKVYIETTIPSYLAAWPSRDLIMAARQQLTRDWWETRREDFELFVSQVVLDEIAAGDPDAASRRLELVRDLAALALTEDAAELTQDLLEHVPLPERAAADAAHIALAVVHGMDYLLTWNFTHIANAEFRSRIEDVCNARGHVLPIICTPEEFTRAQP